jgi:hypothetical protein
MGSTLKRFSILLLIILTGCSSYHHPTKTQAQKDHDIKHCKEQSDKEGFDGTGYGTEYGTKQGSSYTGGSPRISEKGESFKTSIRKNYQHAIATTILGPLIEELIWNPIFNSIKNKERNYNDCLHGLGYKTGAQAKEAQEAQEAQKNYGNKQLHEM